jgi:hypothetical protein
VLTFNDIWIEYDESDPKRKKFRIKFARFEYGFSFQFRVIHDGHAVSTCGNTITDVLYYQNDNIDINGIGWCALSRIHDQKKKVTIEIFIRRTEEEQINYNRKVRLGYLLDNIDIEPDMKVYTFDFATNKLELCY